MKAKLKSIVLCLLLGATVMFAAGCSEQKTPYQINDEDNYTVSIKYDANGGTFTTNTSVIVDSYNLSELATNSDGQAQIALIAPDSESRGKNAFTAVNNGYFLAGWYAERTENGVDENGNTLYTYSGKWDFDSGKLDVDPKGTYSSDEPVLTLYAAWVPLFQIEYYALDSGELLSTVTYNPAEESEITLPQWNEETGAIKMNAVPAREGYTYEGIYLDAQGTQAVQTPTLAHTGSVDYQTAAAENATMKLYVDWTEGEWYHIYTAEQFVSNASLTGNYVIHEDLDFSDQIWPTVMMYGSFTGTIEGNGCTFKNILVEQTNNSKLNAGLFGQLTETAAISDLTFENVTVTIKSGTRVNGTTYGLLAGTISEGAAFTNVQILTSTLQIDSGCYFGTDDYSIGLLCGMGSGDIDTSGITCVATGTEPDKVIITVSEGVVTVEFKSE